MINSSGIFAHLLQKSSSHIEQLIALSFSAMFWSQLGQFSLPILGLVQFAALKFELAMVYVKYVDITPQDNSCKVLAREFRCRYLLLTELSLFQDFFTIDHYWWNFYRALPVEKLVVVWLLTFLYWCTIPETNIS